MDRIFTAGYIFDTARTIPEPLDRVYLGIGLVLVVLGVALRLLAMMDWNPFAKQLLQRLAVPLVTIGVLEVVWFGLRSQYVRLLGSHMVAWLLLLIVLIWLAFVLKYYFTKYKSDVENWRKQQVKLKYLAKN